MKRAKVALITLTVLAAVGGTLAFKANKYSRFDYCTGTSGASTCPNALANTFAFVSGTPTIKYILTSDVTQCSSGPSCSESGKKGTAQ